MKKSKLKRMLDSSNRQYTELYFECRERGDIIKQHRKEIAALREDLQSSNMIIEKQRGAINE